MADERRAPRLSELEDEQAAQGDTKARKDKKPGKEKGAKGKKGQKGDAAANAELIESKRGGKGKAILLTSLVWLLLIGVAIVLVRFDPTEYGDIRGVVLLFLNPEEASREEYWAAEILALMERERELDTLEQELGAEEDRLADYEAQLDDYESAIADREARADAILELFADTEVTPEEALARAQQMAKTVASMTPSNAAGMFQNSDFEVVVSICVLMKPKSLAPIMSALDAEFAGELFDALAAMPDFSDFEEYLVDDE